MLKSHFKFPHADMAKRLFRKSKSTGNFQLLELSMSGDGLDERCSNLSPEEIESLCNFRLEVNMLRAQNGQEAIQIEEAMKCLRASQFNAAKAVDIYQNYQKYRDNLQLDSLKPHREPLSSEIGSKKMEVVGTCDTEGSPIVLFTASRHETFKWDNKSSMQLLFYTLDQVAESELAQERGVVFILDMRDMMTSDPRYTSNILSALKDGYPIRFKTIYVVLNGPRTSKTMTSLQKVVKYDLDKVKIVHMAELKTHFLPEQLPLSLGGTFSHKLTSPVHGRSASDDDSSSASSRKPLKPPSSADSRRLSGGSSGFVPRSGSGGSPRPRVGSEGKTVNQLMEMFEGSNSSSSSQTSTTQMASSHQHGAASKKPIPPPSSTKPTVRQDNLSVTKVSPVPPPKKLLGDGGDSKGHGSSQGKPTGKTDGQLGNGGLKKFKRPLLPHGGGRSPALRSDGSAHTKEETTGEKSVLAERAEKVGSSVVAAVNLLKTQFGGGKSQTKQSPVAKPTSRSNDLAVKCKLTRTQSDDDAVSSPRKKVSGSFNLEDKNSHNNHKPRARADSASKSGIKSESSGSSSASSSPKKLHVTHKVKSGGSASVLPPPAPPQQKPNAFKPPSVSEYENLSCSQYSTGSAPPPTVPAPAILFRDMDARRDSDADVYENINIGFAGPVTDMSGPMPPLPPPKDSVGRTAPQAYENVSFLKSSDRHAKKLELSVEEDDETLFGDEGPPGTQENIYENFGPDKGNKQMSMTEIEAHVEKLGKNGLATEYCRIRNEPVSGPHKTCRLSCNTSKNRYKDVVCCDKTRVKLNTLPGVEGSDYIHANYVDGYKSRSHFILTQGPKDKTVADFWRMIWEKHILVIVMVTKCVELGKKKCALYWPDVRSGCGGSGPGASEPQKYGDYQVAMTEVKQGDGFDVSTLRVQHKGEERTVIHFQFLAWPDYGIPSSGSSILDLIVAVRHAQARGRPATSVPGNSVELHPILVHCSAGVGRSGAFCSIDNSMNELDDRQTVNYQGIVRKMRKQRAYSIQTEDQYEFGYRTLLEYAHNKDKYSK